MYETWYKHAINRVVKMYVCMYVCMHVCIGSPLRSKLHQWYEGMNMILCIYTHVINIWARACRCICMHYHKSVRKRPDRAKQKVYEYVWIRNTYEYVSKQKIYEYVWIRNTCEYVSKQKVYEYVWIRIHSTIEYLFIYLLFFWHAYSYTFFLVYK
jgi:hypothetical protein